MQHISVHAPFLITRVTQISEKFNIFSDTYTFSDGSLYVFFSNSTALFLLCFNLFQIEVYLKILRAILNLILLQMFLLHTAKFKEWQFLKKLITVLPETRSTWCIRFCCKHVPSTPGDRIHKELLIYFATPITRWVMNDPRKTSRSRFLKIFFTFVRSLAFLLIQETCYHHNCNCKMMAVPIVRRI